MEYLLVLQKFTEAEFDNYPTDIIHLIIFIYWNRFDLKISCGEEHNLLLYDGKLYSWGSNYNCQLGTNNDSIKRAKTLRRVYLDNVVDISCGDADSLALLSNGKVYQWGMIFDDTWRHKGIYSSDRYIPSEVPILTKIKKIYSGAFFSLAMNSEGDLFSWGSNYYGQLGLGDQVDSEIPQLIGNFKNIREISCGEYHWLAINFDGEVLSAGNNRLGQLGLGDNVDRSIPKQNSLKHIIKISCGGYHSIALDLNGNIYICGSNEYGQLGCNQKQNQNQNLPQLLNLKDIMDVSCGYRSSMAIGSAGEIYAWGFYWPHQFSSPTRIKTNLHIEKIYCGNDYFLAVTKNKELYGCGKNSDGQLGLNDWENRETLQKNDFRKTIKEIDTSCTIL